MVMQMAQRTERLLVTLRESNWVQLTATQLEMSLGCLSEEWMATQRVMMLVQRWVRLKALCLEQLMEMHLEHLKETPKDTSLVCSSAQWMVMQKVEMTESGWVELKESDWVELKETLMEMSLVCLMVERLDK